MTNTTTTADKGELLPCPTITIGPHKNDDGSYRVEVLVLGLQTEAQACRAADYLTALLCGGEIPLNG